jgi:hypothetical protein
LRRAGAVEKRRALREAVVAMERNMMAVGVGIGIDVNLVVFVGLIWSMSWC